MSRLLASRHLVLCDGPFVFSRRVTLCRVMSRHVRHVMSGRVVSSSLLVSRWFVLWRVMPSLTRVVDSRFWHESLTRAVLDLGR